MSTTRREDKAAEPFVPLSQFKSIAVTLRKIETYSSLNLNITENWDWEDDKIT